METSASCEARSAPSSYSTATMPLAAVVAVRATAVLLDPRVTRLAGGFDVDQGIVPAVMDQHRHAARRGARGGDQAAADRGDGGEAIRHRAAQQVAEERAVREAGRENAIAVDAVRAFHFIEQPAREGESRLSVVEAISQPAPSLPSRCTSCPSG